MNEKFTYEIRPRIPVRNLIPGKMINRPTVVQLDKEGVKEALRHGPVFRRFDAVHIERVTILNLDEMHRASFESKPVIIAAEDIPVPVAVPAMPEPEEIKEEVVEEVVEETVEEEIVENEVETSEEVETEKEEAIEEVVEETTEEIVEEVVEEAVEEVPETVGFDDLFTDSNPDTPNNDTVESEEVVESSEDENVTGKSEEVSEESEEGKAPQYNGNKRKHH